MPVCPHCNQQAARRAKGGLCPNCGGEVFPVKVGKEVAWVGQEPSTTRLLYSLEEHIKKHFGWPDFTFGDRLDDSRLAQLASAKTLLKKCEHDQRLAELVVEAYFDGTKRLWPPKTMHGIIGKQFQIALAIAKKQCERERVEEKAQCTRIEQTEQSSFSDVFLAL